MALDDEVEVVIGAGAGETSANCWSRFLTVEVPTMIAGAAVVLALLGGEGSGSPLLGVC